MLPYDVLDYASRAKFYFILRHDTPVRHTPRSFKSGNCFSTVSVHSDEFKAQNDNQAARSLETFIISMQPEENTSRVPQKMVGWYDPLQLLQTAQQVAVSSVFGQYSDHRLVEVLAVHKQPVDYHDYTKKEDGREREEIWIDYVSDTGDGWDSTYAIAYYASQPSLSVTESDGQAYHTRPGSILILGGDEVYPTPSRKEYNARLVCPYEIAQKKTSPPHPHVFAIPGNHDWYDGLVAFTRLFLCKDWFAGWKCPQQRSYFALKLPHDWWLMGTDVQLGSDIDGPQVEYFKKAAAAMGPHDRIILCNAEPHWIYEHIYSEYDHEVFNESNLKFLESEVFHREIDVFLAGDLHRYRRHESIKDGVRKQKITAGGDGAFLHPTHGPDVSSLADGYELKKSFPEPNISARLCWRNLAFPLFNKYFGALTGGFYLLTAWMVLAPIANLGLKEGRAAVRITFETIIRDPVIALWIVLVFAGIWLFTDTHSRKYRFLAGTVHGLAHLLAIFGLGWAAGYLSSELLGFRGFWSFPIAGVIIFAGGWIIGSCLMGLYLAISLNLFHRHQNEAFSSLGSPDWKNFLRLKINRDGLTLFPIGIRRVPRRWKPSTGIVSKMEPDDRSASEPELIESPIKI